MRGPPLRGTGGGAAVAQQREGAAGGRRRLRALSLALLAAAAGVALYGQIEHGHAQRAELAIRRVELHAWGKTTLTRLSMWRLEHGQRVEPAHESRPLHFFSRTMQVWLWAPDEAGDPVRALFVYPPQGPPRPLDEAATRLVERVRQWGEAPPEP